MKILKQKFDRNNELRKMTIYKIDKQKSILFLYSDNKKSRRKFRKQFHLQYHQKNKVLGKTLQKGKIYAL